MRTNFAINPPKRTAKEERKNSKDIVVSLDNGKMGWEFIFRQNEQTTKGSTK